jgi:uroporphyrinogen decarboxylase
VPEILRRVRRELPPATALVGFAGSPFTVAAYLVEGGGGKGEFRAIRRMAREDPDTLDRLLAVLGRATAAYLRAQVEAGADAVQVFDTWGGILDAPSYARFALGSLRPVVEAVRPLGAPVILYAGGAGSHLQAAAACGVDALSVDHREGLDSLRRRAGPRLVLQGNLDPAALFAPRDELRAAARAVVRSGGGKGHVFNLGHGVWPETDPAAVAYLLEVVRDEGARTAAEAAR